MNCVFCKSFLLIFIHVVGRGVPPSTSTSHLYALFPFFSYRCALFCAFLHYPKSQLFSFQPIAHSSTKNTGVGYPPHLLQWRSVQITGNRPPAVGGITTWPKSRKISTGHYSYPRTGHRQLTTDHCLTPARR